jgi:hypothetical protein
MLGLGVNGTKSSAIGVVADEFVDTVSPSMTITASEVTDGDTSSDSTLSLTFVSSESTTNFAASDITVTNGTISGFTGSGSTYTATFTPTASGACTINVAAGAFTDAAGNNNTAADEFNWTYDAIDPLPVVTTTTPLTTIGSTTATLEGSYTGNGVTEVGFEFGSDQNNMTPTDVTGTTSPFSDEVTGLTGETTYYYRAYATNVAGTSYGSTETFTTEAAPAVSESPFHSSYGSPDYSFEFDATNGTYDFESAFGSLGDLSDISRVSSITDENGVTRSNVMKIQVAQPGQFGVHYAWSPATELVTTFTTEENLTYYKSYAVEMYVFIPSSNSHIDDIGGFNYGTGSVSFTSSSVSSSAMVTYGPNDVGSWKRVLYGTDEDFSVEFGLRTRDGANLNSTYFGVGISDTDTQAPGDIIYISDIKIYSRNTTTSP